MTVRVRCPLCTRALKLRQALPIGQSLTCPACQRAFTIQAGMCEPIPEGPAADHAPIRAVPPSAPILTPIAPPQARPAPPPPPTPNITQRGKILLLLAGALLLLVGSTVGALAIASRLEKPKTTTANVTTPDNTAVHSAKAGGNSARQVNIDLQPLNEGTQAPPPPPTLHPRLQEKVVRAIERGVEYLKKHQHENGSWEGHHQVGFAALPALTLLECGVPADDERIKKAADLVRKHALALNVHSTTYEVSLAVLFLERLREPKDRPLVRSLAMRLVAGQLPDGSWTYQLPMLSPENENMLFTYLDQTRPAPGEGLAEKDKLNPVEIKTGKSLDFPEGDNTIELLPLDGPTKRLTKEEAATERVKLPGELQNLPAVTDAAGGALGGHGGDNSNTQFAALALWVARRQGLPLERSMKLLAMRFQKTQAHNGTWGYWAHGGGSESMTGAGLLGLAIGYGVDTDPKRTAQVTDPRINKGLKAMGAWVGRAVNADLGKDQEPKLFQTHGRVNLYFLWTLERVGVLYNVKDLDGKDWYLWGVELLLPIQEDGGSWYQGNMYHSDSRCLDTCFALLFLKRANLASDITRRLDFVVEGKPTR